MSEELYVIATPNLMRECFREFEPLFKKISRINCYGELKNGLTLRFTNDTRGLRFFKSYGEVKIMLSEMTIRDLQTQLQQKENIIKEVRDLFYEKCRLKDSDDRYSFNEVDIDDFRNLLDKGE